MASFPVGRTSIVPRDFYLNTPDRVAKKLLGKLLVRRATDGEPLVGRIVEVEAYFGEADPAAHSFGGKTLRNSVVFGPPGHAYVYFVYGMHSCLNVSCEPEGKAGCILIRALEPILGLQTMARNRCLEETDKALKILTTGPGNLCQAFAIDLHDNGADLTAPGAHLQIHEDAFIPGGIFITPRIGISKNADLKARYLLADNPFVSGPKRIPSRSQKQVVDQPRRPNQRRNRD